MMTRGCETVTFNLTLKCETLLETMQTKTNRDTIYSIHYVYSIGIERQRWKAHPY